ncbi:MAG: transposase [Myxococcota bacterium]
MRDDVPSLRRKALVREFRRSLRQVLTRSDFRVVHYSLQRTHVHLIVEAAGRGPLANGMKAVGARLARAVNRAFGRRGPVLLGRYHVRRLKTPREARNALAYVLLNARKHWRERRGSPPPVRLDQASSGAWFEGWSREPPGPEPTGPREVAAPHTWLLTQGWRRHRRIDPVEVPGMRLSRKRA